MPLQLAVDEQKAASTPLGLRNKLIGRALAEGESVTEVADALGISEQAVYKIQEALESEPPAHTPGSADLRATAGAVERMTDHVGFEDLVAVLMDDVEPGSIPLGGVADRGRDGATIDGKAVWTISLAKNWQRKVRKDLQRIVDNGFKPKRVFSVTNRRTSRRSEEKLEAEAKKLGIELTVLGQKWLVAKLNHPDYLDLRASALGLARPRPRTFLTGTAYRELLDGRPNLSGFDVGFIGRELELQRSREILVKGPLLLLAGAGGLGKTRLALELAGEREKGEWYFIDDAMPFEATAVSELVVSPETTVVIDNAHRRGDLRQLIAALEALDHPPRVVLIARPGFEAQLNQAVGDRWVGQIDRTNTVALGPLGWRTMSELLLSPGLDVTVEGMRGALIQLAEGNPQIAVIGAQLAKERRSLSELTSNALLQDYVGHLISTAIPEDREARQRLRKVLAVLAALGGIDKGDKGMLAAVADLSRCSIDGVRNGLELLADNGLVVLEGQTYRIKPDLLSEHALFALSLTERWSLALAYEEIFTRFASDYLGRLTAAFGELPPPLVAEAAPERLRPLEAAIATQARNGHPETVAQLIRDVAHSLPEVGYRESVALMERLEDEERTLPKAVALSLRDTALRIADFPQSWKLFLRLAAAVAEDADTAKEIGEAMADVYTRAPDDGSEGAGKVLAWMQHSLAERTEGFWKRGRRGAPVAVCLAVKPMVKLAFEVNRQSADDPMALQLGCRLLPESKYTEQVVRSGARLAAEVLPQLEPRWQLELLETLGGAVHATSGYPLVYGTRLETWARRLLDRALSEVDAVIVSDAGELSMPVRAEAYSYLLNRAQARERLRRDLAEEGDEEGAGELGSISIPDPGADLDAYLFLIHCGQVGPPDPESLHEEDEKLRTRAKVLAADLIGAQNPLVVLDRWSRWCEEAQDATGELRFGFAPSLVLRDVAREDPALGRRLVDHLIATGSELRASAAMAMAEIVASGDEGAIEHWLGADLRTRAALASALAAGATDGAREAMRALVLDEDEELAAAALESLSFSRAFANWRIDLALEALERRPSVQGLSRLLHVADHEARETGGEHFEFDPDQVQRIRRAAIATAKVDKLSGYHLNDMLERASREDPGIVLDWVRARLSHFDELGRTEDAPRLWKLDLLPDELAALVKRSGSSADLDAAVEYFSGLPADSYALSDTATLIGWLGPGSDQVTDLITQLLGATGRRYIARDNLMKLPVTADELDRRAARIAAEVEEPLVPLLDLLEGTLPMFWSGSRVPHLESALDHARRWAESPDSDLRQAAGKAAERFEQMIESERAQDAVEDREFQYGR
jgi:hypothetical protein